MSATQQAIADRLHISMATVSRSLRNQPGINSETRARVLQAAAELGYRFDRLQAPEALPSVCHVGVLMYGPTQHGNMSDIVRMRMLQGLTEQARRDDIALHVDYVPDATAHLINEPDHQPVGLRRGQWTGAILCGHYPADTVNRFAAEHNCVQIADYMPGVEIDYIDHDDQAACDTLVDHLWQRGHRRIGLLGSTRLACTWTRFAGYASAMAHRRAFHPDDALDLHAELAKCDLFDLAAERTRQGVTAWICLNDSVGYQLITHLQALGIRCPEDVAICGFDHFAPPPGLPTLTSIDPPFEDMGVMAMQRLLARCRQPSLDTIHIMLKCRLCEGDTTPHRGHP